MNHTTRLRTFGRGVLVWILRLAAFIALLGVAWIGYTSIPAVYWLGKSLYFEARDEGYEGWKAVANAKFNRRRDPRFPKTIKGITIDGSERGANCDFSWYCDRKPDTPRFLSNRLKLQEFYLVAGWFLILDEVGLMRDTTRGAHSYQRNDLPDDCGWFGRLDKTITIGNHTFYRDKPGKVGYVPPCSYRDADLKGSRAAVMRAYVSAVREGFSRVRTREGALRMGELGYFVRVTPSEYLELVDVSYPYARPALELFITRLSRQYKNHCGEKLVITSLVRPLEEQPRNASKYSVHPAGIAVDFRIPRNDRCRRFLEDSLLTLEKVKLVEATKEQRPPHYHVVVYSTEYTTFVKRKQK